MSTYRLEKLFEPRSVALIGASQREGALGRTVLRNLREAGFPGSILLVNPKYREIDGEPCVARIEDLAQVPDLIVVDDAAGDRPRDRRERRREGASPAPSSSPPGSATAPARSPRRRGSRRASTACASSARTASACIAPRGEAQRQLRGAAARRRAISR